jgi:DNA-binding NarL/FixJ family response regulator
VQELKVLEGLVGGLSNREIGDRLGLSRRTVESHVSHILAKLRVPSRTAAVAWAAKEGLI